MPRRGKGDSNQRKNPEWRSASELVQSHIGGSVEIDRQLVELREHLIADIVHSMGWPVQEASEIVDALLIGVKKPRAGGAAMAASPDAIRMLDRPLREQAAVAKPTDWRSAVELSRDYVGGTPVLNRKLVELREALIADIQSTNIDNAQHIVDIFLIGLRKPRSGSQAIAASPEGIRIAEEFGVVSSRPSRG